MAYLRELSQKCEYFLQCNCTAKVEVVNRYNAVLGRYCRKHGNAILKSAKTKEVTERAAE